MPNLTLYDFPLSGNCHKVRLLLSLMGIEYQVEPVDIKANGTQTPSFLKLNPRGQLPVLADGDTVIWDSMAILVYLARRYGDTQDGNNRWLPDDPVTEAHIMQWLAVSENEILYGLARARAVFKIGRPFNLEECQALGQAGLALLEGHLDNRDWLATNAHPSIADIACYPYVALAPEGEISLSPYPNIQAWLGRIQNLPGYVDMPGMASYR